MKAPLSQMTKKQILTLYRWKCKHGHNGIAHYNCYLSEKDIPERLGFLDIETSNLKANFGIMLCYCVKDGNSKKIYEDCITKADLEHDLDRPVVKSCIADMLRFDRIVGHYSSRFDIPFVRTRAIMLNLPFPQYGELLQTDTWRMAKNSLCLHSNRQAVIAEALLGRTQKTRLDNNHWIKALTGDKRALQYILDHCRKDVLDLERDYNKMKPFTRKSNTSI